MGAGWEKAEGGYRLVRTPVMERQEEKAEDWARRAALLRPVLAKLAVEVPPPLDAAGAKSFIRDRATFGHDLETRDGGKTAAQQKAFQVRHKALQRRDARDQAAAATVGRERPMLFATVPRDWTMTYSSSPNRMQRRLPPSAQGPFVEFKEAHGAVAKALGAPSGSSDTAAEIGGIPVPLPLSATAKLLLIVRRFDMRQMVFEAMVVDAGHVLRAHTWHQVLSRDLPPPDSVFSAGEKELRLELEISRIWGC